MSEFAVRCGWSDGVSCSSFARHSYTLAVSSWDSTLKIISAADNKLLNSIAHSAPVLTCQFGSEDSKVYSGGLDRRVLSTDLGHDAVPMALGSHKAPVKNIVVEEHQIISGSWDASIKVWDERQKLETKSIDLSGKVFALDARSGKVVVGTSDGKIFIFDARNMSEPEQVRDSPLKHQMRCIRISPNGEWFAIGSIEGRVAVEFFNVSEAIQAKKYAFKCHRSTLEGVATAYPVNALAFHPIHGTFASGGCDGIVNVWDGVHRKRIAQLPRYPTSIASLDFSFDGTLLAIASSYTFEQGEKTDQPEDSVFIRVVSDPEVRPKSH